MVGPVNADWKTLLFLSVVCRLLIHRFCRSVCASIPSVLELCTLRVPQTSMHLTYPLACTGVLSELPAVWSAGATAFDALGVAPEGGRPARPPSKPLRKGAVASTVVAPAGGMCVRYFACGVLRSVNSFELCVLLARPCARRHRLAQ